MEIYKNKNRRVIRACTLAEKHAAEIKALFTEALTAVEESLEAERVVMGRDGDLRHLGPDHATRMAALKVFIDVCLRSRRPPVEAPEELPLLTYEEAVELKFGSNREEATINLIARVEQLRKQEQEQLKEAERRQRREEERATAPGPGCDILRPVG